jgi:hypothetical protein
LTVALGIAALAIGACQKKAPPPPEQNMALDEGMPNQMAGNADIETLPADESSTTPSGQLQNGFDDADVNDVGPANSE